MAGKRTVPLSSGLLSGVLRLNRRLRLQRFRTQCRRTKRCLQFVTPLSALSHDQKGLGERRKFENWPGKLEARGLSGPNLGFHLGAALQVGYHRISVFQGGEMPSKLDGDVYW